MTRYSLKTFVALVHKIPFFDLVMNTIPTYAQSGDAPGSTSRAALDLREEKFTGTRGSVDRKSEIYFKCLRY
jgi:hypothetical protein